MLLGTARPEAPSDTRHDGDPGSWMAPPRPVPQTGIRGRPARCPAPLPA